MDVFFASVGCVLATYDIYMFFYCQMEFACWHLKKARYSSIRHGTVSEIIQEYISRHNTPRTPSQLDVCSLQFAQTQIIGGRDAPR